MIAREYGFASWAALQAEVASRVQSPAASGARCSGRMWRPLSRALPADGLLDDEANIQANQRFFLWRGAAQIGFLLAALVGLALLWVTPAQVHLAHAVLGWLGGAR